MRRRPRRRRRRRSRLARRAEAGKQAQRDCALRFLSVCVFVYFSLHTLACELEIRILCVNSRRCSRSRIAVRMLVVLCASICFWVCVSSVFSVLCEMEDMWSSCVCVCVCVLSTPPMSISQLLFQHTLHTCRPDIRTCTYIYAKRKHNGHVVSRSKWINLLRCCSADENTIHFSLQNSCTNRLIDFNFHNSLTAFFRSV